MNCKNRYFISIGKFDILRARRQLFMNGRLIFMAGFCYKVHEVKNGYAYFESVKIQVPLSLIEDFFYIQKIIPELCKPRKISKRY